MTARRSRKPVAPLSSAEISAFLWHACKTHGARGSDSAGRWQHRLSPSAGGRHPIDVLVLNEGARGVIIYDPIAHVLNEVTIIRPSALVRLATKALAATEVTHATVLWFAAQPDRTMSKYRNAESLIWRDAGALLATCGIVAEALGLALTPVGLTGDSLLRQAFGADERLAGVGGCVIGARPTRSATKS